MNKKKKRMRKEQLVQLLSLYKWESWSREGDLLITKDGNGMKTHVP
jgi:hypothetical protein